MKVFRARTGAGWILLIAANTVDEAYGIAAEAGVGYVDYDSVYELTYGIYTDVEDSQILDEF